MINKQAYKLPQHNDWGFAYMSLAVKGLVHVTNNVGICLFGNTYTALTAATGCKHKRLAVRLTPLFVAAFTACDNDLNACLFGKLFQGFHFGGYFHCS